jgi:putative membrane protein
MQPEQRLHPLSILFRLVAQVRAFALPGIAAVATFSAVGLGWQVLLLPLAIPFAVLSILEYLAFRYRYDANEMVIRTGFLFRNERHVPYARIQNLHAVQNVFHRLWKVVEVRVETGGADEPEATMSVLPVAAYEEMRQRVFGERNAPAEKTEPAVPDQTLLHLSPPELMLAGFIQNRGFVVLAAAFGLLWEMGILDKLMGRMFGEEVSGRGLIRTVMELLLGRGEFPLGGIALAVGALISLVVVSRVLSMGWALVSLHGFRLTLAGEDLRAEYGLLTRVATTIALRRIQTLTVRQGVLHRLFKRAAVRVGLAGGGGEEGEGKAQREWLAPILPQDEVPRLLSQVLGEKDFAGIAWRGVHPRAFRREVKGWILVAVLIALPFAVPLKGWVLLLLAGLLAWAFFAARRTIAHMGWAVSDGTVLFRSGWLRRQVTAVRFSQIQAVTVRESPFDRRTGMASIRVDTAGAKELSHRVDIPYLPRETAWELCDLLASQAGRTAFRW